jgi:hypothetical protein
VYGYGRNSEDSSFKYAIVLLLKSMVFVIVLNIDVQYINYSSTCNTNNPSLSDSGGKQKYCSVSNIFGDKLLKHIPVFWKTSPEPRSNEK